MINISIIEIRTYLAQISGIYEAGHHANETLIEQKSRKMVKGGGGGGGGIILTRGYSDYYCKRPLYSMYLFGFIFTVL